MNRRVLYLLGGLGGASAAVLLARKALAKPYVIPYPESIVLLEGVTVEPRVVCDVQMEPTLVSELELDYLSPSGENQIPVEMYRNGTLVSSGMFWFTQPASTWTHHRFIPSETVEVTRVKLWTGVWHWPFSVRNINIVTPEGTRIPLVVGEVDLPPRELFHWTFPVLRIDSLEFDYQSRNGPVRLEIALKRGGSLTNLTLLDLDDTFLATAPVHYSIPLYPAVEADEILALAGFRDPPVWIGNFRIHRTA
ncbi:MAG: hypothetical protein QXR87_03355 [Candidatus Hadarchaeales archaeon]